MPMSAAKTHIGAWTADPALNLLERDGRTIRLEPRAMDVLVHLAARAGAVSSVEDLMSAVWKGVVVSDGSVYLAISQLRQALGDTDEGASYIETVPKRGYRLIVPVEPHVVGARPVIEAGSRRRWTTPALMTGVVAALLMLVWTLRPGLAAVRSLAVLPFADLSPAGDQAYFADGITEEILNRLSRIGDLRVIARTSSFQMRGQGSDPRALSEKLNVEHVLVGSVRKAADRVRITAQLSETRSGVQLWSQTYERRLDDIFAIQDEIAKAVAAAMQVKLGLGEPSLTPGMTRDVAAYDEYLRGMALNIQGRAESIPPAIAHLQRAVAIDPKFSMAWSGLHGVYSNGALAIAERAEEWRREASESLERAREITPDAPHVLLQLGIASVRGRNYLEGAELFRRLEKSYAEHGMVGESTAPRGTLLLAVGRIREAIPLLENARAIDPLAPAYAGFLSRAYNSNRDHPSALAEVDRGLKLEGFHDQLLNAGLTVALSGGDRREIERRLAPITDETTAGRINRRMALFLDKRAGVDDEIRALTRTAKDGERAGLAVWAAYYGEDTLALELLTEVAPRLGHHGILWIPLFAKVRSTPEFVELAERLGMAAYWRVYGYADSCKPVNERIECR
jgi:TolB-like protein/DNA-binding winged helix-turn-helix (wHTH) protein/tetratricopeptide (TPR) repeat protein